jgi:hypothetical protein
MNKVSSHHRKGYLMPQTIKTLNLINSKYWESFIDKDDYFHVPGPSSEIYGEMSRKLKGVVKASAIYQAAKYHQDRIKAHAEQILGKKLKKNPTTIKVGRRKPQTVALLSLISSNYKYWHQFQSTLPSRTDKIYEDLMNDPALKKHKMSLMQVVECVHRYKKVIKDFNNPHDSSDSEMEVESEAKNGEEKEIENESSTSGSEDDEDEEMEDVRTLRNMDSGK